MLKVYDIEINHLKNPSGVWGDLTVGWKLDGGWVELDVQIPANTAADILLTQGGAPEETDGLSFRKTAEGWQARAGSGRWRIRYPYQK